MVGRRRGHRGGDGGVSISVAGYKALQTEAEFLDTVRQFARLHRWLVVHLPQMLANPSGFPDLLLFRDGKLVIAELKVKHGQLGPRQKEWCERLWDAGFPVHVWYPADWPLIESTLR